MNIEVSATEVQANANTPGSSAGSVALRCSLPVFRILRLSHVKKAVVFLVLFLATVWNSGALPQRLIIAMDGISYRDVKALQAGVVYTNFWGVEHRHAFGADEGYYPVSRMISTFPSTSDVAWTDIFGNRPLPGYQRTYYSVAANSEIAVNALTSTMEHESEMYYQSESDFARSMSYLYSVHIYDLELHNMLNSFWNASCTNFYAYIRSSDDAQHMDRDVFSLLATLNEKLQRLRARYKAEEGHDLQILIISDHGHNHAGRGERVQIIPFLEQAGYRVARSIQHSNDVVLPTAGIEDWIEIHNAPSQTETLAEKLTRLQGMDMLAARLPDQPNRFLVLNSRNERATIDFNPAKNSYRYSTVNGDPLDYGPVSELLSRKGELDSRGFGSADDWMNATMTNHYPVALQRIVRGLTRVTLNPATILVSLNNHYVHAAQLINDGSRLVPCGSTHGALDDINSMGIILSNFTPTHDTSSDRVAAQFDNFPGVRKYRDMENGAEWVCRSEQARARIRRDPFDWNYKFLPKNQVFLRVWSPLLSDAGPDDPLAVSVEKVSADDPETTPDPVTLQPTVLHEHDYTLGSPISFPQNCSYEKIYPCPTNFSLEPFSAYRINGWMQNGIKSKTLFDFIFYTDGQGKPVAY